MPRYGDHLYRHVYVGQVRAVAQSLAALCLGLAVTSCGDSAVTKRDFVARADAICASALRHTRTIAAPSGTGTQALASYLDEVGSVLHAEAGALHGLRRPAASTGQREQLRAFLSAFDAAVGHYAALAAAAHRGDTASMAREEAALRGAATAALAGRYGLRVCGAGPSTAA